MLGELSRDPIPNSQIHVEPDMAAKHLYIVNIGVITSLNGCTPIDDTVSPGVDGRSRHRWRGGVHHLPVIPGVQPSVES